MKASFTNALSQNANHRDESKRTKKMKFTIIQTYETKVFDDMETNEAIDFVCEWAYDIVKEGEAELISENIGEVEEG